MRNYAIGRFYHFEYHCDPSPQSQDYVLAQHTTQPALVVRELSESEVDRDEVGRMFEVVFEDGLRYDVFEDELIRLA